MADDKEHHVLEEIGPGTFSPKDAPSTDPDEDHGDQEEKYSATPVAPPGKCVNEMKPMFRSKITQYRECCQRNQEQKQEKP